MRIRPILWLPLLLACIYTPGAFLPVEDPGVSPIRVWVTRGGAIAAVALGWYLLRILRRRGEATAQGLFLALVLGSLLLTMIVYRADGGQRSEVFFFLAGAACHIIGTASPRNMRAN